MKLLAYAVVPSYCPSSSIKAVKGREKEPAEYQRKIREVFSIKELQSQLNQKNDWRLVVRLDFYLSRKGRKLLLSDPDNLSKTALDGIFNEKEGKNSMRDRWVYSLEARKIEVSNENEERTEIWVFAA